MKTSIVMVRGHGLLLVVQSVMEKFGLKECQEVSVELMYEIMAENAIDFFRERVKDETVFCLNGEGKCPKWTVCLRGGAAPVDLSNVKKKTFFHPETGECASFIQAD